MNAMVVVSLPKCRSVGRCVLTYERDNTVNEQ